MAHLAVSMRAERADLFAFCSNAKYNNERERPSHYATGV
jgi:hypothetical protein